MIRALFWVVYMGLIGYAFVSLSLATRSLGRRVLLAGAAAAVLATYHLATQ